MAQGLGDALLINIRRHIVGGGFGVVTGIAHGHADTGIFQHGDVVSAVTKGDGFVPGPAKMLQHRGQAVGLAAALGQDIGKIGAPPHGQAAGAAAEKLFLIVIGQKGAELVDGVLCNAGSNVSGPLPQLLGKVGTALIDEIEIAVVLLHKADGQLFFFNIGQQRAQGGCRFAKKIKLICI